MFPLKSSISIQATPLCTWTIILLNVFVFFLELSIGAIQIEPLFESFGLVPVAFVHHFSTLQTGRIFSSMFLHAGVAHLFGNMWFLQIFGCPVEDRIGHGKYFALYLLFGTCAAAAQLLFSPDCQIPMVGASGAISGVLGAYIVLYPRSTVLSLIPFGILSRFVEVPASFFLGFWFLMQLFTAVFSLTTAAGGDAGGIAFWAHIGGFLSGAIVGFLLRRFQSFELTPDS